MNMHSASLLGLFEIKLFFFGTALGVISPKLFAKSHLVVKLTHNHGTLVTIHFSRLMSVWKEKLGFKS